MERLDHTNLDFEQLSLHCSKFIQDLVMFVMENMHNDMELFFKEHCLEVDADDETHSHKYYDLFKEYCILLESKLDVFVEEQGLNAKTLFKRLQAAQEENDLAAQIVQYLLGATDYERFVDLLLDRQLYFYGPYSDNPKPLHGKKKNDDNEYNNKKSIEDVDEGKKSDENSNNEKIDRKLLEGNKTGETEDDDFVVKKNSKK
jgi:hypothetical protein